jgi:hypothetical protein
MASSFYQRIAIEDLTRDDPEAPGLMDEIDQLPEAERLELSNELMQWAKRTRGRWLITKILAGLHQQSPIEAAIAHPEISLEFPFHDEYTAAYIDQFQEQGGDGFGRGPSHVIRGRALLHTRHVCQAAEKKIVTTHREGGGRIIHDDSAIWLYTPGGFDHEYMDADGYGMWHFFTNLTTGEIYRPQKALLAKLLPKAKVCGNFAGQRQTVQALREELDLDANDMALKFVRFSNIGGGYHESLRQIRQQLHEKRWPKLEE